MITSGMATRYAIDRLLGGSGLTRQQRMDEAILARRCRNVFWNALAPVVYTTAGPSPVVEVQAQHRALGFPIIITDILNFSGNLINLTYWQVPNFLSRLYTTEDARGVDFFGAGNFTDTVQTLGHYRSNFSPTIFDGPSNKIHFNPYLLKEGQIMRAAWKIVGGWTMPLTTQVCHEADFRGVTVLGPGNPYAELCGALHGQVCEQIKNNDPETVILDVTVPAGTFAGNNIPVEFSTEPQQRPLLIYGIGTNINGVQAKITDLATQWQFCILGPRPGIAINDGVEVPSLAPEMDGIPLYVAALNAEITNRDAYHLLAVPHLLEPNNRISFRLASGLRPRADVQNTFQQSYNTIGLFDNGNNVGRISLLCRTV